MFLDFFESACQKRIRLSKIVGRFRFSFAFFYVETVLQCTCKTIGQRTDRMSHRDRLRATWKQNTSIGLVHQCYYDSLEASIFPYFVSCGGVICTTHSQCSNKTLNLQKKVKRQMKSTKKSCMWCRIKNFVNFWSTQNWNASELDQECKTAYSRMLKPMEVFCLQVTRNLSLCDIRSVR